MNKVQLSDLVKELASIDSSLSHIKRIAIVMLLLLEGPMSMSSLSKVLGIPINALDTHLRKLEEHELIIKRKVITPLGPRTYVFLTNKGIEKIEKIVLLFEKYKNILASSSSKKSS